ncbi:hypothetical protein D3C72_2087030 [compost metagenome]
MLNERIRTGCRIPFTRNTQHVGKLRIKRRCSLRVKAQNRPQHQGIGKPVWHVIMAAQRISERMDGGHR